MKQLLTQGALILCMLAAIVTGGAVAETQWTQTSPAINATHVFLGEINRHGKPVGFHAKLNGKIHKDAKIVRIQSQPNRQGVYTAVVAIRDPANGEWKEKFSSMFPDNLDVITIVAAIEHAYQNREQRDAQPWRGPSGHGFQIEGYTLRDGRINTAYPIFTRDRL